MTDTRTNKKETSTKMLRTISGLEITFGPGANILDIKLSPQSQITGRLHIPIPADSHWVLLPASIETSASAILLRNFMHDTDRELTKLVRPIKQWLMLTHRFPDEKYDRERTAGIFSTPENAILAVKRYADIQKLELLFSLMVLAPYGTVRVIENSVEELLEMARKERELTSRWDWYSKGSRTLMGLRIYDADKDHLRDVKRAL
jgi:hypothetical protein